MLCSTAAFLDCAFSNNAEKTGFVWPFVQFVVLDGGEKQWAHICVKGDFYLDILDAMNMETIIQIRSCQTHKFSSIN